MTPLYEVTIHHDDMCEDPTAYSPFKVVSFSRRHSAFEHPDPLIGCHYEDDDGVCGALPWDHAFGDDPLVGLYKTSEVSAFVISEHDYVPNPDILFTLNYEEHGRCRWGVNRLEPERGTPFDSVSFAGLLMWDTETDHGHDRAWWDGLTFDEQYDVAVSTMKEYTSWSNGDCYGYNIDKNQEPVVCGCCGQRTNQPLAEWTDSCWGFIGDYVLESAIESIQSDLGRVPVKGKDYVIHGEDTVI